MIMTQPAPPAEPQAPPTAEKAPRGGDPTRFARLVLLLTILLLEVLPLAVWLALLADLNGRASPAALTFGGVFGLLLGAYLIALVAGRLRQPAQPGAPLSSKESKDAKDSHGGALVWRGRVITGVLVLVGFAVSLALTFWLSPAGYSGMSPQAAVVALGDDVVASDSHFNAILGLFVLLLYLWWRALDLARKDVESASITRRFVVGLTAIVVGVAVAAEAVPAVRPSLETMFAVALPVEVFAGLLASALAHALDVETDNRMRRGLPSVSARQSFSRPWLLTTLGISGSVVVVALLASLFVSVPGVTGFFGLLAPIGNLFSAVAGAVTYALAYVLFLVFNGVYTFLVQHSGGANITVPKLNMNCAKQTHSGICGQAGSNSAGVPDIFLTIGHWFLLALVVVIIAIVLMRMLGRLNRATRTQSFEEERTSLDARALLGQQLRDLFRRRPHVAATEEALRPGSVRALYRDLLRAARRAGYPRQAGETPAEYATRLAALAGATLPAAALDAITHAYYPSRYAPVAVASEGADGQAPPALRDAFGAVSQWLSTHEARTRDTGTHEGRRRLRGRRS